MMICCWFCGAEVERCTCGAGTDMRRRGARIVAEQKAIKRRETNAVKSYKNMTVGEHWQEFNRQVLDPIDAPDVQRQEMRKAFYAGAQSVLSMSMFLDEDGKDIPSEDSVELLAALHQECSTFADDVLAGRA